MYRRRGHDHQQRTRLEHDGHTAVLGSSVVGQVPVAGLDERRPGQDGDGQLVLQLHVHDRQRGRAERGGRRQRVQTPQTVRLPMRGRSSRRHSGANNQRAQRPENRVVLNRFFFFCSFTFTVDKIYIFMTFYPFTAAAVSHLDNIFAFG